MGLLPSSRLFTTLIWGDVSCSTRVQSTALFARSAEAAGWSPKCRSRPSGTARGSCYSTGSLWWR